MECSGKKCPMPSGFDVEKCELECRYFTPKCDQKTKDYYDGFFDAARMVMEVMKAVLQKNER